MNYKILLKYIIIYIPFIFGVILYNVGAINLVSSLLVFLGGYIAIKNTFDYRIVRKNIKKYKMDIKKETNNCLDNVCSRDIVRIDKIKREIRVRKRVKK